MKQESLFDTGEPGDQDHEVDMAPDWMQPLADCWVQFGQQGYSKGFITSVTMHYVYVVLPDRAPGLNGEPQKGRRTHGRIWPRFPGAAKPPLPRSPEYLIALQSKDSVS